MTPNSRLHWTPTAALLCPRTLLHRVVVRAGDRKGVSRRMYCFHCGKTLIEIDGVLTCTAGQMPLSQDLQSKLTMLFPSETFPSMSRPAIKTSSRTGIFCPGCGVEAPSWVCPSCATDLVPFQRRFIELHPHWYPETTNWGIPLVKHRT